MELDFDAAFVEVDEESSGTLIRKNSKVHPGRNLNEDVANDTVEPEMERDVTSGGENIDINSGINSQEEAANRTCKRETEMNMNFAASDEESSSTLVLNTSELNTGRNLKENEANGREIMIRNIEVGFNKVQNSEVKLGGEIFEAEQSKVTTVEQTERHANKEYLNGGSTAYPLRMDPSNKSAVLTDMSVDSTHLKASSEPSVFYVEDKGLWKCRYCSWVYPATNPGIELIQKHKEHCEGINNEKVLFEQVFPIKHEFQKGSQINANLDRGSETINYESKETEFVMSEMVSQTMTEKQNDQKWPIVEGIWHVREKDEKQLRENQIKILEKSALEGNVEDIVKILKEQESHDLFCPNCGSCITKRVILRKRKRTSLVSEGNNDVQAAVSEEEHEITEDQSNRPEMSTEAYGCLACFSIFFRRGVKIFQTKSESGTKSLAEQYPSENRQDSRMLVDKEKDSLHCFPFLYPWGHNKQGDKLKEPLVNKEDSGKEIPMALDESNSHGRLQSDAEAGYEIGTSERKSGKQAESIPKTMPSESNLRIADTLQQNEAFSEISTTTVGTGSMLTNDGEKTTTVNEVGLNEDHTFAENGKKHFPLNAYDKDDVAVEEFTEKLPSRAARHPNITIQNITSQTSTTTTSTSTYSSRTENVETKETKYTATEATESTPYLDGDSESLQLEEHYPRLPNLEITEGQLTRPPSSSTPTLNGQTGRAEAKFEVTDESIPEKKSDMHVQHADELAESKHLEKQHAYQNDVKRTKDQQTELHFSASSASSEEHRQGKTEQHYVYASSKHVDNVSTEIETSMDENRIRPQLVTQGQASNGMSDSAGNKELPRSEHQPDDLERNIVVGKGQSDKKDYLCSCIPVSIPSVWSIWSSKELIADEQLKKPLLADLKDRVTIDKDVPVALRDDQQRKEIFPSKLDSVESSTFLETRDPATLVQRKVDDSVWPNKVDDSVSQSSEISPDSRNIGIPTDGRVETVINIVPTVDSQLSNLGTPVSELPERPDWDLLKSIVYGGLTVSITSLGVVSSAAGGEAKTLFMPV